MRIQAFAVSFWQVHWAQESKRPLQPELNKTWSVEARSSEPFVSHIQLSCYHFRRFPSSEPIQCSLWHSLLNTAVQTSYSISYLYITLLSSKSSSSQPRSKMSPKSTKNARLRRSARLSTKPTASYVQISTRKPNNKALARKSKAAKLKNSNAKAVARTRVIQILDAVTKRVALWILGLQAFSRSCNHYNCD